LTEKRQHEVRFVSNRKVERFGEIFLQCVLTARRSWKFCVNQKLLFLILYLFKKL